MTIKSLFTIDFVMNDNKLLKQEQIAFLEKNWNVLSQDARLWDYALLRKGAKLWGGEEKFKQTVRYKRIKFNNKFEKKAPQKIKDVINREANIIVKTLKEINQTNDLNTQQPKEQKFKFKLDINEKILDGLNQDLQFLQDIENNDNLQNDPDVVKAKNIYQQSIVRAFNLFDNLLKKQQGTITLKKEDSNQIMNTVEVLGDLYFRLKTVKYYDNVHHNTKQYEMISAKAEAMLGITKNANLTMSTEGLANQHLQEIKAIEEQVDIPAVEEFINEAETLTASPQP